MNVRYLTGSLEPSIDIPRKKFSVENDQRLVLYIPSVVGKYGGLLRTATRKTPPHGFICSGPAIRDVID